MYLKLEVIKNCDKYIKLLFFFALLIALGKGTIYAQNFAEQEAQILYNIPKNLEWEWDDPTNLISITIGSLGDNTQILDKFEKYRKRGYPNGTTITVFKIKSIDEIKSFHILLVGEEFNNNLKKIKENADLYNTLVVTRNASLVKYTMLNFNENKRYNTVTFSYNSDAIDDVSIRIVKDFESIGGTKIEQSELVIASEEEIKKKEEEIEKKNKLVKQKQKELEIKNNELTGKTKEINNQNIKINEQEKFLEAKKKELDSLQEKGLIQKQELEAKTEILNKQSQNINEQKKKLTRQKLSVREQKRVLEDLTAKANKQKKRIEDFKNDVARQEILIKAQKNIIYLFVGFLSIVLFLIILVYRAYRKMKQFNKELGLKNVQIKEQSLKIEQQNKYTEAINKELEKLSIIAQESRNAISIYDIRGDIEWVNIGFTRLYGYTLQLWINQKNINIVKADRYKDLKELITLCVESKEAQSYETMITTRFNTEMWVQRTITPLLNTDHNVSKLVIVDSDITDIKKAEQEIISQHQKIIIQSQKLAENNKELEKLSLVASKTDNSVVIFDKNGYIEWANDGFERMLEIKLEDFRKEYGDNIYKSSLHPEIKNLITQAITHKKSQNYSSLTITKKGKRIWIQTSLTPIFNEEGLLDKIVTIDSDITKIKLAEEEIVRQKQAITDSIIYARRIQKALLPPDELMNKLFPKHMIFYRPKDIVSGDFYYIKEQNGKIIVVVADCTGHGVPGAFMSMLGIAFLNEIMAQEIPTADKILNKLRDKIKTSLRQSKQSGSPQDGMDLALAIIDKKNKSIEFSGANNPLLHLSKNKIEQYRGDWMPIGIYVKERPFTSKIIEYNEGDKIYLHSDGITDQIGGPRGRKFMAKRLRQLLVDTSNLSINEQYSILEKEFDKWQGKNRQLDDILFVGIEL